MQYKEFGKQNSDAIILLHGGGLSWWNYREAAELLQDEYHVILPILDGHAGCDCNFSSIENNANEIIAFIDNELGGAVLLMAGLSLGGQVLLEILSQRKDICQYVMIESALVIPSRLTYSLIKPAFGSAYGLIKRKWFSRLQFRSLHMKPELFDAYYRDTCGITKQNMIAFLQANAMYGMKESLKNSTAKIHIYVGEKENKVMRRSAGKIHEMLPGSSLHVLPNWRHGEFSINHADYYADELRNIISFPPGN